MKIEKSKTLGFSKYLKCGKFLKHFTKTFHQAQTLKVGGVRLLWLERDH